MTADKIAPPPKPSSRTRKQRTFAEHAAAIFAKVHARLRGGTTHGPLK